jgi:hypothetical protein
MVVTTIVRAVITVMRAVIVTIPVTVSLPVASAANRNGYDRRIGHRTGSEKSPAERAKKSPISRQPRPGIESGIPEPATSGIAVAEAGWIRAVAVHRRSPGGLIAQAGVVFGANITPGVEFVFFFAVKFFRLQQIAEHYFLALT